MSAIPATTATAATLALAATLAWAPAAHAANNRWGAAPPPGTTYWISNGGDLVVIKRSGNKVRTGNPLSPCFTGIKRPDGGYSGGGPSQNTGYLYKIKWFKFAPKKRAVKTQHSDSGYRSGWYYRSSRWEALHRANPSPPNIKMLFSDCEYR